MKNVLLSLITDIHHTLDQTRIFSIHNHQPYYDEQGIQRYRNMGENNQVAKDRIMKLISDCGKMKDHIDACVPELGFRILKENKISIAVLHDLCNYIKHPDPSDHRKPQGNFKPSVGDIKVFTEFGTKNGSHAGIISAMDGTSFWDIGSDGYAFISMEAGILDEQKKIRSELISLVKSSLRIWKTELKNNSIEIPDYVEADPMQKAIEYGQHASLFVESYNDAYIKASILTREKRFEEAAILYSYAIAKCKNNDQRAQCYNRLGLSYEDAREFRMAQASYITAIKHNPNMRGLHLNFGRMCEVLGDKNTAKSAFQKELELSDGDHKSAHINLENLEK